MAKKNQKTESKLNKWMDGDLSVPLKYQPERTARKKTTVRTEAVPDGTQNTAGTQNKAGTQNTAGVQTAAGRKPADANPAETGAHAAAGSKAAGKKALARFLNRYRILVCALAIILLAILLLTIFRMPPFGDASNPVFNEVTERYVGSAEEETGAENVIAGMILNYRGFDTFGESCVLFLAVCCVMMLLGRDKHSFSAADLENLKQEEAAAQKDLILETMSRLLIPCILCFGICVLFNGHVSPGGGFSGGSVLGASLILYAVAFGQKQTSRFMTEKVYNIIRVSGLCIYGVLFGVYIFLGANAIESPLSRYIVSIVDIAVGLVVMSTMYGFYSYYTKGEL